MVNCKNAFLGKTQLFLCLISFCLLINFDSYSQIINSSSDALSGFSATEGLVSTTQSVDVSSAGLTEDIELRIPANFEISIDGGVNFTSNTNLVITDINTTFTIQVRIASNSVRGMISERLLVTSTGIQSRRIDLRGIVIPENSNILFIQESIAAADAGISSQDFTDLGGTVYTADEFIIPTGESWEIQEIGTLGTKMDDPINDIRVRIWLSDGTGGLPGTVFHEEVLTAVNGSDDPNLTLQLAAPLQLSEGTYWLSVTPILAFNGGDGRWFWERTTNGIGNEFHLLDPNNIFGTGFTDWSPANQSISDALDQVVFSIVGTNLLTWTGTVGVDWDNPSNWNSGTVPDATVSVLIPDVANTPVISSTIEEVINLTVQDGATVTVNSGAGLSVQGTARVEGTGSVNIQRNTVDNLGLSTIGSPIIGATVESLGADVAFEFNETSNSFSIASGMMTPGEGIFIGFDNSNASADFSGTPNSGTITLDLTNSNGNGFNLVSNPYAAPISRSEFLNINGSDVITGTIYLFDDGGSNIEGNRGGDYIAVNNMGATTISLNDNVDGNTGSNFDENTPIGSVQGFFVQAIDATETLTFNPDMQVTTSNVDGNFYREDVRQLTTVRLSIKGTDKINHHLYNDLIIGFDEQATDDSNDFALDAIKLLGNDQIAFYSLDTEENQFAIQALPISRLEESITVPLGFDLANRGGYSLRVESFNSVGTDIIAFLEDRETGEIHELSEGFNLPLNLDAASANTRFSISFSMVHPGVITFVDKELAKSSLKLLNGNASSLTISFPHDATAVVYDLTGKVVVNQEISMEEGLAILPVNLAANHIYILEVAGEKIKFLLKN